MSKQRKLKPEQAAAMLGVTVQTLTKLPIEHDNLGSVFYQRRRYSEAVGTAYARARSIKVNAVPVKIRIEHLPVAVEPKPEPQSRIRRLSYSMRNALRDRTKYRAKKERGPYPAGARGIGWQGSLCLSPKSSRGGPAPIPTNSIRRKFKSCASTKVRIASSLIVASI